MDRFTTKENPKVELLGCIYCMEHSNCYSNMSCDEIYNAFSKLRYYEDLEEQGRLIILPAKTVFVVEWDAGENCDMKCPQADQDDCPCDICPKGKQFIYEQRCKEENIDYIGRTVFLTREAAEASLNNI